MLLLQNIVVLCFEAALLLGLPVDYSEGNQEYEKHWKIWLKTKILNDFLTYCPVETRWASQEFQASNDFWMKNWGSIAFITNNQCNYTSNMGMTAKSYSKRLIFVLDRSLKSSGSMEYFGQNIVSKRQILWLPQMFRSLQSWNQCLFYSDSRHKKKEGNRQNHEGHMCIGEPSFVIF